MVLPLAALIGTLATAHAQEAVSVWAGRPIAVHAPDALDRPGLDRLFENAGASGGGATAAAFPAATRSIRFNGALFPRVAFASQQSVKPSLVKAIDRTEASLRLVLYDFNQAEVLEAILRAAAKQPPVQIQLLLDSSHAFPSNGKPPSQEIQTLLKDPRLDVRILRGMDQFGTMHNKFAIFDDKMLEYGSYNWTKAADARHFENALFTNEQRQIGLYYSYFKWMWERSGPATGPAAPPDLGGPPPADLSPTVAFNGKLLPAAVFSPAGASVRWLTEAIRAGEKTVDVAMYSFYEQSLADRLVEARSGGRKVRVLLDRDQAVRSLAVKSMKDRGMTMRLSRGRTPEFSVMHHKFAIFDGKLVETGSFNWTNNAQNNNFENLSFLTAPELVAEFQSEFERVWAQATPSEEIPEEQWAQQPLASATELPLASPVIVR